jgi:hypothetical protein
MSYRVTTRDDLRIASREDCRISANCGTLGDAIACCTTVYRGYVMSRRLSIAEIGEPYRQVIDILREELEELAKEFVC